MIFTASLGGPGGSRLSLHSEGWRWGWDLHVLVCLITLLLLVQTPPTMAEGDGLISVDYEVFGKVQGVYFRKYTQVCVCALASLARYLHQGQFFYFLTSPII